MEQYREKLRMQNLLTAVGCILLSIFCILTLLDGTILALPKSAGWEHWPDFWRGFCSGAAMGILLLMVFFLVRNMRAMQNEAFLKKLYVKEHDERAATIYTTARSTAMQVFLIGGLAAVCVAGYFSMTVGLTILGCVLFCSLTCLTFKLYFSAKL